MFGYSRQEQGQLNALLEDPNCTVDALLKCPNLASQFRNSNPKVTEFLTKEKNVHRIIELIHTSRDKVLQKSVISLFQTSNVALHRVFADSIPLTEYAISILNQGGEIANYSFGIISRLLSRAFSLWPEDMSDVFRLSSMIYPTLIRKMDMPCVYYMMQDLLTEVHRGTAIFVFHAFMSIIPDEERHKYMWQRRSLCIKQELMVSVKEMTWNHRRNIFRLIGMFFRAKGNIDKGFDTIVVKYLRTLVPLTEGFFNLAGSLPPDPVLKQYAVRVLLKSNDFRERIVESAMRYIAVCTAILTLEEVIKILFLILIRPDTSNLVLLQGKEMLSKALEREETCETLKFEVKQVLAYVVNNVKPEMEYLVLPFVVTCAKLVNESEMTVPCWDAFVERVVDPWSKDDGYDETFKFNEGDLVSPDQYVLTDE